MLRGLAYHGMFTHGRYVRLHGDDCTKHLRLQHGANEKDRRAVGSRPSASELMMMIVYNIAITSIRWWW